MNRRAEMGMGTLIIFIAMILVAATAATVLLSTTTGLRDKALSTGKATVTEVGTALTPVELYAEDGTDGAVDYLFLTLKLAAGSGRLKFSEALLTFNLKNTTAEYTFNTSVDCSSTGTMTAGGTYGVSYQINGSNHQANYLSKGDVALLCFQAPRTVTQGERLTARLLPRSGAPLVVEALLPNVMLNARIPVYP